MMGRRSKIGLMLATYLILLSFVDSAVYRHHNHRHDDKLIGRAITSSLPLLASTATPVSYRGLLSGPATPCSDVACPTANPALSNICPSRNETAWKDFPTQQNYTVVCDIDFPAQNIYPFVLAGSFEGCMAQCESYNAKNTERGYRCEGFVFAPERLTYADDCYLKSSIDVPFGATVPLVGATRAASFASTVSPLETKSINAPPSSTSAPSSQPSPGSISAPKVTRSQIHGASVNNPTTQWVYHNPVRPMKLDDELLKPGINCDLITNFEIAGDTGTLTANIEAGNEDNLTALSVIPHLSRDGGKGGELDGYHIFTFCDTASFTTTNETQKGDMVGFASSSVAIDENWNGNFGKPLSLVDGIGQWNDDVGRMRGYSPMTHGEESFNIALSGDGHRYAVWPMSSIIPLNQTHAIQYASLVYDEANMTTQDAVFTTMGNTLLTVSVDKKYGPTAERTVKQLFSQGEVMWGTIGGIRSWGLQGIGGMDGKIYVFGQTPQGVLLGRTNPDKVADRYSYEYWSGQSWTTGQLPSTATSFMIEQTVMDFDLFYSPRHQTFIMVYLTPHADNTFYYRYLNASEAVIPPYIAGENKPSSDYDYVEQILQHPWSEEAILFKAPTPPSGNYIYAGSVHMGYFGEDDITKGGTKMLLSWTEHTGVDAATPKSGYAHMTAGILLE